MRLSILDQSPVSAGMTPAGALSHSVALAEAAEALGYTRYWIAEHHAMPALASTAPEILIARIAATTQRMRVGSGAVLLPYYAPLKVAEKDALPDASVVTSVAPSQVWPSPWPLASPVGDEKNSSR